MSHTAENKTQINFVNESILQNTLELIAKNMPGLVITGTAEAKGARISSYRGQNDIKCDIAIHGPGLSHGLGLNFRNGEGLVLVAGEVEDSGISKLQHLILLTYQTLATQRAVESLGYKTEATSKSARVNRLEAFATA